MNLTPIDFKTAARFCREHHRHNLPPQFWKFGVGVSVGERLVGVAVAMRPNARALDDGVTLEISRTCTDGTQNANSMLYGAIGRAAKALGYHRLITYTLESESGCSLRASSFQVDAELPHTRTWDTPGRRRQQNMFGEERYPQGGKIRWVRWLQKESVNAC